MINSSNNWNLSLYHWETKLHIILVSMYLVDGFCVFESGSFVCLNLEVIKRECCSDRVKHCKCRFGFWCEKYGVDFEIHLVAPMCL